MSGGAISKDYVWQAVFSKHAWKEDLTTNKRQAIREVRRRIKGTADAAGSVKTSKGQLIYQCHTDGAGKIHVDEL